MLRLSISICAEKVLTIVGEDYQDIYKANKSIGQKGALVKTEEQKYTS